MICSFWTYIEINKPKKKLYTCLCLALVRLLLPLETIRGCKVFFSWLMFCRLGFNTCNNDNPETVYM
jgi:hypothetical protein